MNCRAAFLIFLLISACSRPTPIAEQKVEIDRGKFDGLYRATKAIDAAVAVSVTNPEFRKLLQAGATELSIAKDRAKTPDEIKVVDLFSQALSVYRDSLGLWDAQMKEENVIEKTAIVCAGEVADIAAKNGLEPVEWSHPKIPVIPRDSLQYLWALAGVKLRKANSFYYGNPSLEDTKDPTQLKESIYKTLIVEIDLDKRKIEAEKADEARKKQAREALLRSEFQERTNSESVYIPVKGDGHYHTETCRFVSEDRMTSTLYQAVNLGLTPCQECKPPHFKR